jgi:catechol 2,3-dioxygenase-like lactoylglutathione lyase family enzyme
VPAGRVFHFAFEVSDARRAYEVLRARGVRVRGEPQLRPDGCVQVFCHDPDGHVVEIFHRP